VQAILKLPIGEIPANLAAITEGGPGRYVTALMLAEQLGKPAATVIDKFTQGHTVSQRLRKLKQIPAELYPLCTKRLIPVPRPIQ
jgi:hypothetical protein